MSPEIIDLTIIEKEISPIVLNAQAIVIKNEEDKINASEILSKLNKYNDELVEDREKMPHSANP